MKYRESIYRTVLTLTLACVLAATLKAQNVYVLNYGNGTIGEYGLNGTGDTSLISGLGNLTWSFAISGTNLFIPNLTNGTVGEYTTSGATVNASFISWLLFPYSVAISGTNLFVLTDTGTIGEYTTSGAVINALLISGLTNDINNIAVSGTNLFVVDNQDGVIGEYTTSGATVNPSLISGLFYPDSIAILGTNLFVANGLGVGEYTTSGATVNASFPSSGAIGGAFGIAAWGTNLLVATYLAGPGTGSISEYTTSGALVYTTPISGLNNPMAIAVANGPPPPMPQLNVAPVGNRSVIFYPSWASGYVLQSVTNLASTNWTTVTNGMPIVGVMVTNNLPASFFRLAPAQ